MQRLGPGLFAGVAGVTERGIAELAGVFLLVVFCFVFLFVIFRVLFCARFRHGGRGGRGGGGFGLRFFAAAAQRNIDGHESAGILGFAQAEQAALFAARVAQSAAGVGHDGGGLAKELLELLLAHVQRLAVRLLCAGGHLDQEVFDDAGAGRIAEGLPARRGRLSLLCGRLLYRRWLRGGLPHRRLCGRLADRLLDRLRRGLLDRLRRGLLDRPGRGLLHGGLLHGGLAHRRLRRGLPGRGLAGGRLCRARGRAGLRGGFGAGRGLLHFFDRGQVAQDIVKHGGGEAVLRLGVAAVDLHGRQVLAADRPQRAVAAGRAGVDAHAAQNLVHLAVVEAFAHVVPGLLVAEFRQNPVDRIIRAFAWHVRLSPSRPGRAGRRLCAAA